MTIILVRAPYFSVVWTNHIFVTDISRFGARFAGATTLTNRIRTNCQVTMEYMFDGPPEFGATLEVAPGVHWLRMPLPMALDHINLWLIEDGPGWTLIDTGLYSKHSQKIWQQAIDEHLGGRPLRRVIITHFHPDHIGMAGGLVARSGAEFWMTRTEWLYARMLTIDIGDGFTDAMVAHYRRAGGSAGYLAGLKQPGAFFAGLVSEVPRAFRRIGDGEQFEIGGKSWKVVVGNGHSPEHACLLSAELGLLVSGDLVLPKISPHIGVYGDEPDGDPLRDYLDTLARFHELPGDAIVLPSHGEPFVGLHGRLDELILHHEERLVDFTAACAEPATAIEIAHQVFKRNLDAGQLGFAAAETVAHLNYLIAEGRVTRRADEDGVHLYQAC
jgi:glyoxylase-like metal-dependent hydrolase (beta-lactamase superfamily II)